jgi:hypothetical protein
MNKLEGQVINPFRSSCQEKIEPNETFAIFPFSVLYSLSFDLRAKLFAFFHFLLFL